MKKIAEAIEQITDREARRWVKRRFGIDDPTVFDLAWTITFDSMMEIRKDRVRMLKQLLVWADKKVGKRCSKSDFLYQKIQQVIKEELDEN